VIAYEPDGRVCPRCERIYHKKSIPNKCACGQDLAGLRHSIDGDDDEEENEADEAEKAEVPDAAEDEAD
jgi:hypothetical protein